MLWRLSIILILAIVPSEASIRSILEGWSEVSQREQTLLWLGDARTQEFRHSLFAGLDKDTKAYIENNVAGDYRAEILHNYDLRKQELVAQILKSLKSDPNLAAEIPAHLGAVEEPFLAAHQELLGAVGQGLKFAALQDEAVMEVARKVQAIQTEASRLGTEDSFALIDSYYRAMDAFDIPIWWFDDKNYSILYETSIADSGLKKIDLNTAGLEDLMTLPGVSEEMARKILASQGNLSNVRDLMSVAGLSESEFRILMPYVTVDNAHTGKKKWTVLVYICASNDLERFGVSDVNEMETVGSDENINVVVQLDRINAHERQEHYADFQEDGNWEKTRRYYVTRDEDPNRINSQLIQEMGNVDMGDPGEFYDFMKFGVDQYPAEHYMVVLWNHGAGWPGIAYDDKSGNHLTMERLTDSFRKIDAYLEETQGKDRIDIVNMDACLMAMLEVGYELRGAVRYLVGSQEVEPGAGMPYGDYLAPLKSYPDMTPRALSRNMVEKFVRSYTTKGSQSSRYWGGSAVTQSAIEVDRLDGVADAVNELAIALMDQPVWWEAMIQGQAYGVYGGKRYATESFVDLKDFTDTILKNAEIGLPLPESIADAAQRVQDTLGIPEKRRETDYRVRLTFEQPAYLVWGVDDWKTPSAESWPRGTTLFRSRFARTPLAQEADGTYAIEFEPFQRMKDRETQVPYFPKALNYRFVDEQGRTLPMSNGRRENTIESKSEYRITQHFRKDSPIVIEGHTQGMKNSYGLSIYVPFSARKFEMPYRELQFARDTQWDELMMLQPEYHPRNRILVGGGIAEAPRPVRDSILGALKDNSAGFDVVLDPGAYRGGIASILSQYENGGIFITTRPDGELSRELLERFVENGGKLVLLSTGIAAEVHHQDFLRQYFGIEFGGMVERQTQIADTLYGTDLPSLSIEGHGAVNLDLFGSAWVDLKEAEGLLNDSEGRTFASVNAQSRAFIGAPIWRMSPDEQTALMKSLLQKLNFN